MQVRALLTFTPSAKVRRKSPNAQKLPGPAVRCRDRSSGPLVGFTVWPDEAQAGPSKMASGGLCKRGWG